MGGPKMLGWLKDLFRRTLAPPMTDRPTEEDDLQRRFDALLCARMEAAYPALRGAFAALFQDDLPQTVKALQIAIFVDELPFSIRLFGLDEGGMLTDRAAPVATFNDRINQIWPIMSQAESDAFTIWEDDPTWGRQVALEQPLDGVDIPARVIPWLRKIVSQTKGGFARPVLVAVHDYGLPRPL